MKKIGIVCIVLFLASCSSEPKKSGLEAVFDKQFSKWDGSHRNLVKLVKSGMNDPSSFEHIETRFGIGADSLCTVQMKYRGKNAFGGVVPAFVTAKVDMNGTIIEILK